MINLLEQPHLLGKYLGFTKLQPIHSTWIKNCWMNTSDYVLQAHRNSYKTTAVLIVGVIWYLLFNPDKTILIVRKEFTGASGTLAAIYKLYTTEKMKALYHSLGIDGFEVTEVRRDFLNLPTRRSITKEGNIEVTGIGGDVTGRHYDKIIGDDIITRKDRWSRAERDKSKDFLMELQNIKNPGGTLTVTGSPWHKEDGYSILPPAVKYPLGSIYIPDMTPAVIADIKKRITPSLYAANYELKHIAEEGKLFAEAKYRDFEWEISGIIAIVDPAYKGRNTTSLTILMTVAGIYICTGWVWRKNIEDLYSTIASICKNKNVGTMYIEANADKGLSATKMREYYPNVQEIIESENKHNKIVFYLYGNWNEVYFDPDCQEEYMNQVVDYEEGLEPDDAPDGLADGIRILSNRLDSGRGIEVIAEETGKENDY